MKISIQKKISGILFLTLTSVCLSIGIFLYLKYTDYMTGSIIDKLYNGMLVIDTLVDIEGLPNLNMQKQNSPEYLKSWKRIKNIQKELKLAYIYIVLMNDRNQFYFIYDTGDDPMRSEPTDTFFKIYNDAPSEAFESFASGKMTVVKGQYTNILGTFQSAFYPLRLNGKIIGIIGADYNISDILELKRQALLTIIFVLFIGIILVILYLIFVQRWIINPIIGLNNGIQRIANGNLDYSIVISRLDEIGELEKNINIMVRNLKAGFTNLERHNERLKEKVEERTEDWRTTLNTAQELKTQQERDYFLAALIANALMQNRNNSSLVKIDFLLEQRERFQLNGNSYSLGGDICIAGNLNFFGKTFTMFFSGDAMGKSMQGAIGVIVIGSLVNSIMSRSAANKRVITKDSERWLRETFFELQKVMEAFNGAIHVSCILGVIDDESGILQFFNAEYPLSVIYRDGKASFVEGEITAHKLGMQSNTEVGLVQFQLLPGDVIFCGSDGKDNLVLGNGSKGVKIINDDKSLFLKNVESSSGKMEQIYNNLLSSGQLSDDLSIVRIAYKEISAI